MGPYGREPYRPSMRSHSLCWRSPCSNSMRRREARCHASGAQENLLLSNELHSMARPSASWKLKHRMALSHCCQPWHWVRSLASRATFEVLGRIDLHVPHQLEMLRHRSVPHDLQASIGLRSRKPAGCHEFCCLVDLCILESKLALEVLAHMSKVPDTGTA